jgi:CHAT domain-containing protein
MDKQTQEDNFWVELLNTRLQHGEAAFHQLMQQNLCLITPALCPSITQWVRVVVREHPKRVEDIASIVEDTCISIKGFPHGKYAEVLEIAIHGYKVVLSLRRNNPEGRGRTLTNLGNAYGNQAQLGIDPANNLQLAIAAYGESGEIMRRLGLETDLSGNLTNLGNAYLIQAQLGIDPGNNLQLAIAAYGESGEIMRRLGLESLLSQTLNNQGVAYRNQAELGIDPGNNLQLAIAALQKSEQISRRLGLESLLSQTLTNLGIAYLNQAQLGIDPGNNLQRAIAAYGESGKIRRRLGLERDLSLTLMNQGNGYLNQAQLGIDPGNNLRLAIAAYGESAEISRRLGLESLLSRTLTNLGNGYLTQAQLGIDPGNNLQLAIAAYREALTYLNPTILPVDALRTARHLGNLGFNQGDWHIALEGYQIAMTAIDYSRTLRTNHAERDKIVADAIGIYENAIQAAINLNDIATALEIVERVRAKRLVDLMATADLYQGGDIPPQIQQWLQQLDDLDNHIANLQSEDKQDTDGLKTLQLRAAINVTAEIAELQTQKKYILDQINNVDEVVTKLRQLQPPQLQDFHPLLTAKTTLLSFYTTAKDTHILILHAGETQPHCFTCQGQGYEKLQGWLKETWATPYITDRKDWTAKMPHTLAEVAQRLEIERLITEHLQGTEELLIVPHLYLHQIPFAALPITEGYLGDKFLIRYAPSLQVLGFCYNPQRLSAKKPNSYNYGTAENATGDLPFSGFEGIKVAEMFGVAEEQRLIRQQATRTAYRQLLQQASHIVSSHHAQSQVDNPLESGLKLSDGKITVSQLFSPGWRFPQLQEVFLSCCETGLFQPESITDEPVAVSTAFLCAGASGVIASQWSVNDCSAALLSILYHQQRQQGLNRPRALQAAQRQMRQMTPAEFKKYYRKQLESHIKEERERMGHEITSKEQEGLNTQQERQLLTKYGDAAESIKSYSQGEGLPFKHPFHWGAMGCYGLG